MKHNFLKHSLIAALLIVAALQTVTAQESRTITLKEAIDLGITNSKQLKNNKARIAEATAAIKEATDNKLPDFKVGGSYLYLPVHPTINLKSDTSGNGGGPSVSQAMYGSATVSLPLYTGGKLKYGVESAKYLEQAEKLDADGNREAIILNLINAYSNLYKSAAAVKIVKDNLVQGNQRVTDFSNLEKNGLLARNDLLKVQLQVSNIELALLDAENNQKLANVNMDLMLGLPEQTILTTDSSSFQQVNAVKTIDEYEQLAFTSRKDLSALGFRKKAADLGIKSEEANKLPTLALTGGYIAAYVPNFVTITNAVNIGVGLSYNVSSLWKNKARVAQAQARVEQISANQDMLNDEIRLQINQAYQDYLLSNKRIDVYRKAIDQASENYRITKNKYDNALATTTDLLDADVAQLQTKLNLSNATADAVVAYNKLLQTAGLLNNQ